MLNSYFKTTEPQSVCQPPALFSLHLWIRPWGTKILHLMQRVIPDLQTGLCSFFAEDHGPWLEGAHCPSCNFTLWCKPSQFTSKAVWERLETGHSQPSAPALVGGSRQWLGSGTSSTSCRQTLKKHKIQLAGIRWRQIWPTFFSVDCHSISEVNRHLPFTGDNQFNSTFSGYVTGRVNEAL